MTSSQTSAARSTGPDLRVQFDAEVTFRNGGGLQVQGFRLDLDRLDLDRPDLDRPDLDRPEVDEPALAARFVRELGLLMVDRVTLDRITVIREQHKGPRGDAQAQAPVSDGARRLVELSHPIHHGMVTYPGLPGPELSDHLSREASHDHYAEGTEFQIGRISMVANTGTYLDTPFHRFADGPDLSGIGLERLVDLDGLVVRVGHEGVGPDDPGRAIGPLVFAPYRVTGRAVLVHTGWDRHWGTGQYGSGNPFLTREAAEWLVAQRPALVGIDSLNIDDTADGTRPAHTLLLEAGIPVVEHLRGLEQLPADGFRFHAAPPRIAGLGTFPVRAFAVTTAPADGGGAR
ncbi:cyclase family protein [Kitasatospora sp. NPDC048540]|uniref:cyclase family protein n=1 Tax=Kitasatospora sp. NPDC048540 TaxID=3155634 RepID=UPI0034110E1B